MFIATRASLAGIVFLLLTTWISGPRPTPVAPAADVHQDVPAGARPGAANYAVNQMQQILLDKGHYRGKVDGVLGLRTRASIRGYQRAESLPVTGQLDVQTAVKLGVKAEVRETTSYENQDKPSAGIQWTKGSRGSRKPLRRPVTK
jgi:peptidoglycan hydrolase-like protein with peptidoglycan-binding domain